LEGGKVLMALQEWGKERRKGRAKNRSFGRNNLGCMHAERG